MSVKIDLLPGYVGLRRWFKRLSYGALALVAARRPFCFCFIVRVSRPWKFMSRIETTSSLMPSPPRRPSQPPVPPSPRLRPKKPLSLSWCRPAKTGSERAALIDLLRRYIYEGAVVSTIDLSDGTTAKINATVATPQDYAQFLLGLRSGSVSNPGGQLFAQDPRSNAVTASGIPGGPNERFILPVASTEPTIVSLPLAVASKAL
jgi:hypothetical protein